MGGLMGSKTEADVKSTSTLTPAQRNLSNALIGYTAGNLFGPQGTLANPNVYPGQRVAGVSPLQQGSYGWASQLPYMTTAYQQGGLQALNQATQPLDYNPVANYTNQLWQNQIMPSIMERQAGMDAGRTGGTTQALIQGGQDLTSRLQSELMPYEMQQRGNLLNAAGQYQSLGQMPLAAMSAMNTLGTGQRATGQEFLSAEQAKWVEGQPWANPAMAYALQLLPQSGQLQENIVSQQPRGFFSWLGSTFR